MSDALTVARPSRRDFVLRRLHSLTGIVPIGVYLIFHIMFANASVLGGREAFDRTVATIGFVPGPLLLAIEVLVIYLPLLFHAGYGFVRVADAELDNPLREERVTAYLYSLQRLSGVVAFFFIGWHIWTTRWQYYFHDAEINYEMMHGMMTSPLGVTFFLLGTLASIFHFTNGIWTFCITWGITVGPHAQRVLRQATVGAFIVMYGTAVAIMMAFRA
jgi:succinate dehydrogenase / fumarate reductase, cytochrome b subunit